MIFIFQADISTEGKNYVLIMSQILSLPHLWHFIKPTFSAAPYSIILAYVIGTEWIFVDSWSNFLMYDS